MEGPWMCRAGCQQLNSLETSVLGEGGQDHQLARGRSQLGGQELLSQVREDVWRDLWWWKGVRRGWLGKVWRRKREGRLGGERKGWWYSGWQPRLRH